MMLTRILLLLWQVSPIAVADDVSGEFNHQHLMFLHAAFCLWVKSLHHVQYIIQVVVDTVSVYIYGLVDIIYAAYKLTHLCSLFLFSPMTQRAQVFGLG